MAILTNEQLAEIRREWCASGANGMTKPEIDVAIQAVEDFYESTATQQAFGGAVLAANPSFPQDRIIDLIRAWAQNRVQR